MCVHELNENPIIEVDRKRWLVNLKQDTQLKLTHSPTKTMKNKIKIYTRMKNVMSGCIDTIPNTHDKISLNRKFDNDTQNYR